MEVKFNHFKLPKRIDTISGYYEITNERTIKVFNRDLLLYHGYGVVDNSCCGIGGCEFVLAVGFIKTHKAFTDDKGLVCSLIEKIKDELKEDIKREIKRLYPYSQIVFWDS